MGRGRARLSSQEGGAERRRERRQNGKLKMIGVFCCDQNLPLFVQDHSVPKSECVHSKGVATRFACPNSFSQRIQ